MNHDDGDRAAGPDVLERTDVRLHGAVSAASVHDVFTGTLGVRVPDDDTDVISTGLLDSLGVAELLLTLEERFGITIDMATLDLDDIRSVRSIVSLVAGARSGQST